MEIDLEIPLGQEKKLDTAPKTNIVDSENGVHAEEVDVNSPWAHGPVIGNRGSNEVEDIFRSGEGLKVVTNTGSVNFEPQSGLEFESKEAAYSFYREYARSVGFGITIRASRRSKKSGKFIDVKIACSRFGNKRESSTVANSRSCPKTDCKASMHMKKRQDGIWYIYSFVKEHNHEICPDDFYYAIKGRGKQSGNISCQKKGLQLALHERDVQVLLENFMILQAENPSFLYAVDLDQEKRMRNVFWVDAKGRNDYKNFCDVVLFDTNYVKRKYNIPFAPIVGVNHHFQFILLGCALIGDETASSFVWLMRTWLKAMGGEAPTVVITDEDKSLKEAIVEVFPDARHCFCLWHVLRKIPKNLGHTINRFETFVAKFEKCIHQSWTDDDFEKRWWKMVDKFELRVDEWIQSLYEDRKKWAPTYMTDTSLAGLSTVERCDSIPSFFDKYMERETTFKEFIDQYKIFLHDRYVEEAKADFETRNKQPTIRTLSPYEKQMSMVYTHAIFEKFQIEVLGTGACSLRKECEGETTIRFLVDDFEERQNFIVNWNESESNICCSCRSFEYKGFLCRHALIVLQISGVSNIPSHYILRRWTKDANTKQITNGNSKRLLYRVQRFNDLCKLATKLGEEGSLSQESYNIAFYALEEALKHCVGANNSVRSVSDSNMFANQGFLSIEEENGGNNIAKASKRKKVQKKRKVQAETELISIGRQVNNQQMELLNERANSFDISYVPQLGMQGMDLSSRTPNFDGYFSAQQSTQGEGQLSSVPSMRDGYYANQQGMQGLGQLNSIPTRVDHFIPQQRLQALLQGQLGFGAPTMHGSFGIQDRLHNMEETVNITSKHLKDKHLPR